jgi:phage terminase small subunit
MKADKPKQMPILGGEFTLRRLSAKERRFVEEYPADCNGAKAAERAGYSIRTARQIASKLLTKAYIQMALAEVREKRSKRCELTADRILLEVKRLSLSDIRKLYDEEGNIRPIHELDDATAACIAGIEVVKSFVRDEQGNLVPEYTKKYKLWDKNSALEKAGKHLKLFAESVNLNVHHHEDWLKELDEPE